jgi:hypothetical protein
LPGKEYEVVENPNDLIPVEEGLGEDLKIALDSKNQ